MARRKKEELVEEVIEETKVTEEIETPAEQPEFVAEVKEEVKEEVPVNNSALCVVITAPRVNIRKSPSLVGDIQKIAAEGDKFDLVNDGNDGFYEIKCDNSQAFVMKKFAKIV